MHQLTTFTRGEWQKSKRHPDEVQDMTWGQFKPVLSDGVVEHIAPIQNKYNEFMTDEAYLDSVLLEGRGGRAVAEQTLQWAKDAMGFHTAASRS